MTPPGRGAIRRNSRGYPEQLGSIGLPIFNRPHHAGRTVDNRSVGSVLISYGTVGFRYENCSSTSYPSHDGSASGRSCVWDTATWPPFGRSSGSRGCRVAAENCPDLAASTSPLELKIAVRFCAAPTIIGLGHPGAWRPGIAGSGQMSSAPTVNHSYVRAMTPGATKGSGL